MIGPHSVRSRVTLGGSDDWIPVWSPDGAQVFFMSYRNGVGDIYAKSVGGSTLEQPVVLSTSQKVPTDISSDGRYVAYWSESTETLGDVWVSPVAPGGAPISIAHTSFNERAARFSPDGRFIAYSSNESGRDEVYVQLFPPTGGKW